MRPLSPDVTPTLDQLKILSDPSRLQILALLFDREMTVTHLAEALGLSVATVHHHVTKLLEAGLIHQTRAAVRGNLLEKYYRVEGRDVDSSELWERVAPEDKAAYRLSVFGMLKGLVDQAIRTLPGRGDFPYAVGRTDLFPLPWRGDVLAEAGAILAEARERLAALEVRHKDDPGDRLTLVLALLPTG